MERQDSKSFSFSVQLAVNHLARFRSWVRYSRLHRCQNCCFTFWTSYHLRFRFPSVFSSCNSKMFSSVRKCAGFSASKSSGSKLIDTSGLNLRQSSTWANSVPSPPRRWTPTTFVKCCFMDFTAPNCGLPDVMNFSRMLLDASVSCVS